MLQSVKLYLIQFYLRLHMVAMITNLSCRTKQSQNMDQGRYILSTVWMNGNHEASLALTWSTACAAKPNQMDDEIGSMYENWGNGFSWYSSLEQWLRRWRSPKQYQQQHCKSLGAHTTSPEQGNLCRWASTSEPTGKLLENWRKLKHKYPWSLPERLVEEGRLVRWS